MGILDRIQHGRQRRPITACVYGVPGVGKTTFGASAPGALIYCIERGAENLDVGKVPAPASWTDFIEGLRELAANEHKFKSLVVDTLDALELIAIEHVCKEAKKATLSDFAYGAGYALLVQEWRVFLRALEILRDRKGMNIILIAHEHRKTFDDPALGAYAVYRPKLQDKVWALTNEWVDAVLFAQFDMALVEKEGQKDRAYVTGERLLYTQRSTGFVAKNRYGLPPQMPLDWALLEQAATPLTVPELKARLEAALTLCTEDVAKKARAYLAEKGETEQTLRACLGRAETILAAKAA